MQDVVVISRAGTTTLPNSNWYVVTTAAFSGENFAGYVFAAVSPWRRVLRRAAPQSDPWMPRLLARIPAPAWPARLRRFRGDL